MIRFCSATVSTLAFLILSPHALAVAPSKDELNQVHSWAQVNLAGDKSPFSFVYGGRSFAEIRTNWSVTRTSNKLDENRTELVTTWNDPPTGLVVRCVAIKYSDFPTVEWTLYFNNTGKTNSPRLSDVQALDARFERRPDQEFILHSFKGSACQADDYAPSRQTIAPWSATSLASKGYPTQEQLPFFNVDWGGEGLILAIGWPGSWTAQFIRDGGYLLGLKAGMTRLDASLLPGEEIRSPLIVLQFWKGGDWIRSQNVWRRWMIAHNLPRPGGQLPKPFMGTCIDGAFPGMLSNAAEEIRQMDEYLKNDLKFDYWWIDAGWYVTPGDWFATGSWEPDPKRYPHGVKEVSDHAHANGMKFVTWFEPERANPGTWLYENHPEWLLHAAGQAQALVNLGIPEAWKWVVERIDKLITEQGIDLYRQDFNCNPGPFWAGADKEGRVGITEIKHVTGYLAFWDELRRRHPKLLIDCCASGGRRNDLETLRRAVPCLRSDYRFEPNGTQGHNYGISFWMPFHGTGIESADPYLMRSHYSPSFGFGGAIKPNFDFATRKKLGDEWRQIADNFLGDFYPLTSHSVEADVWMVWQFDRPEAGQGVLQIFRRAESPYEKAHFKLRGLEAKARYVLKDLDKPDAKQEFTGSELMNEGLFLTITNRPAAMVIAYRKMQ